jgi:glycosyltransferase involved in cell wall biosynthesis
VTARVVSTVDDRGCFGGGSPQPLSPERWVVCQLGARMHYAVPRMLSQAGKLECFYTDLYGGLDWTGIFHRLPEKWRISGLRRLMGRVAAGLPNDKVYAQPMFGAWYYLRRRTARDTDHMSGIHLWAGRAFGNRVVKSGFGAAAAVYTFNTAAREILRAARGQGLFTVVEQTIVPRKVEDALLKQEHDRHPGWEPDKKFGFNAERTARREAEEWALADLIVCGSEFVRAGIAQCGGPVERCAVVPYGVDSHFAVARRDRSPGPLRVLTVGELGLRKGAPTCLEVAQALGSAAEFRWVGPTSLSAKAKAEVSQAVHLIGAVPRSDIRMHYEWADVFFLPSICEGSATVTYEALTCGLPVLTTPNAGSTVEDGITGFIAPVGNVQTMVERLRRLHEDRALLKRMSTAAAEHSCDLSFAAYQHRLLGLLERKRQEARASSSKPS